MSIISPDAVPQQSEYRPVLDFTTRMAIICHDMTQRVAELHHIDMTRVAVGFCQTRKDVRHGTYASLTPMRFENGSLYTSRHNRTATLERLYNDQGVEMLYILNFYLPRFLQQEFKDKLVTIVHELLHVSPAFDGDIRRLGGRCYAHSGSQKNFDAYAEKLAIDWWNKLPDKSIVDFLYYDFDQLMSHFDRIVGKKYSAPKLVYIN